MDGRRRQRIGRSVLRAVRVGRAADAQMAARPGRMAEDRRRDLRPRSLVELDKELPGQVMASLGFYGLWNYYWYTGDRQTLADVYPAVQRDIALWKKGNKGTMLLREGRLELGRLGHRHRHRSAPELLVLPDAQRHAQYGANIGQERRRQTLRRTDERAQAGFQRPLLDWQRVPRPAIRGCHGRPHPCAGRRIGTGRPGQVSGHSAGLPHAGTRQSLHGKDLLEAMLQMGHGAEGLARHNRRFSKWSRTTASRRCSRAGASERKASEAARSTMHGAEAG